MIEQYNLDTKGYDALRKEMVEAIPHYTNAWTDFNASDPGITLVELLCFVADTILYRTNRIPDQSYLNTLRLVAGATRGEIEARLKVLTDSDQQIKYELNDSETTTYILYLDEPFIVYLQYLQNIEKGNPHTVLEMQRAMLSFWELPYRTITSRDFNQLAIGMTSGLKTIKTSTGTSLAKIPPWAQVTRTSIENRENEINVVLISGIHFSYQKDNDNSDTTTALYWRIIDNDERNTAQLKTIAQTYTSYLTSRLLAGTTFFAEPPIFTPVYLDVEVLQDVYVQANDLIIRIQKSIVLYLDPNLGGDQQNGWPYNKPVTPDEITSQIEKIIGVAQVNHVYVNQSIQPGVRATIGLNTLLGVSPTIEASGLYFKGLPQMEQLIITVRG